MFATLSGWLQRKMCKMSLSLSLRSCWLLLAGSTPDFETASDWNGGNCCCASATDRCSFVHTCRNKCAYKQTFKYAPLNQRQQKSVSQPSFRATAVWKTVNPAWKGKQFDDLQYFKCLQSLWFPSAAVSFSVSLSSTAYKSSFESAEVSRRSFLQQQQ